MDRQGNRRRARAISVAVLVAVTVLVPWVTAQHVRASTATLALTPNTNVVDGQYVKVDLTGLQPSVGVAFRQCVASPVHVGTDCTSTLGISTVGGPSGTAETYLPLYSGKDPMLKNASGAQIPCDAGHACVLAAVFDLTDLSNAAFATIGLAASPDDCPDPGASAVFGSGAATAYRAIYGWQSTACLPPYNLPMIYAVNNSFDGVASFAQGQQQANYAVTGPQPPLALPSTAPPYKVAPLTGSGVVLAYKMYDQRGFQITNLTLTPWMIRRIYSGGLNNLAADPGVNSINPGVQFPQVLHGYSRADHSSETWVFTSWLWANLGPGSWPYGPLSVFPPELGSVTKTGSRAIGNAVSNPFTPWYSTGNIGYMDSSTAAYYGLPTVNILTPATATSPATTVAATPTTIAQGLSLATQNPDGTYTPAYTPTDPTAYPMSIVSSMLVPTDQITPANGKVLAAFLKYCVQAGQTTLPGGYTPLPAAMVNRSMAVANLIPQTEPSTPASSSYDAGAGSFAGGDLGGLGANDGGLAPGYLGGSRGAAPQPSARAGGKPSGGTSATSAPGGASSGPVAAVIGSSAGRWALVGLAAVAVFGVVVGPLAFALARPPAERPLRRLRNLVRWRWPISAGR